MDSLIEWLKNHSNRLFDFSDFYDGNADLLGSAYSFVFVHGVVPENLDSAINVENIEDVHNLRNTVLTSTPILFFIDDEYFDQFRKDLSEILNRDDVREQQIFFLIHPLMNKEQVRRVISDLGVNDPQVVDNYDDVKIIQYFKNYPVTEYVRNTIDLLSAKVHEISEVLEEDNLESQKVNEATYRVIDQLENDLLNLKEADSYFMNTELFEIKQGIQNKNELFQEQIHKWKNRKTKVTTQSDAEDASEDFVSYLQRTVDTYFQIIDSLFIDKRNQIFAEFKKRYARAGVDLEFDPDMTFNVVMPRFNIPEMKSKLLELKDVHEVEQKNNFLGLFAKDQSDGPRIVTNYFFENWRDYVLNTLQPLIDKMTDEYNSLIAEYADDLAGIYHEHLEELISMTAEKKEMVVSSLSEDERKLQEDNNWLSVFKEQLLHIERD